LREEPIVVVVAINFSEIQQTCVLLKSAADYGCGRKGKEEEILHVLQNL